MDYDMATPDTISDAIFGELRRPIDYREVENDGAERAAELIAPLI